MMRRIFYPAISLGFFDRCEHIWSQKIHSIEPLQGNRWISSFLTDLLLSVV